MRHHLLPLLPALVLAGPVHASAQRTLEARVSVLSSYVWRGLTIVNKPVVQPEATLALGAVSFGLWANVEPVRYDGANDISALAGRRAPGFTEVDPTVELSHEVGKVELAAGAIAYAYPHAAGHETAPNTFELYGSVRLPDAFPLELAGYYDAHAVKGLYLEAGIERGLPRWPALQVGARIGASFGEASGPETAYYERDGVTLVELSASLPFTAGPLKLSPEADLDLNVDGATRITSQTGTHRAKARAGFSIAWPRGSD